MAVATGVHQGRFAILVFHIQIRTPAQQLPDHRRVASKTGIHQGRSAPLVLGVHICALAQQRPDRLRAAFKTGENEQNLGNAVSALEALGVFDLERLR